MNDNQRFHETLLDAARNPELRRRVRRPQLRGADRPAHARARRPRPRADLPGARRDHRRAHRAQRGRPRGRRRRPRPREPPPPRRRSRAARLTRSLSRATRARRATPRPRPRAPGRGLRVSEKPPSSLSVSPLSDSGASPASQWTSAASSSSVVRSPRGVSARRIVSESASSAPANGATAIAFAQKPVAAFSITATRSIVCSMTPPRAIGARAGTRQRAEVRDDRDPALAAALQQRAGGCGGTLGDVADRGRPSRGLERGERSQLRSRRDRDEDVLARERDTVAQVTTPWQLVDGAAEHAERAGQARSDRIGWGEECGRHLSTAPSRDRRRPGRTRPSCRQQPHSRGTRRPRPSPRARPRGGRRR